MKTSLTSLMVSGTLALFSIVAVTVKAQPTTVLTPPPAAPTAAAVQPAVAANDTQAPADLSVGAKEVLKLQQAGTAPEVLKGYADTSGYLYSLSANDIIYLNKTGVPNETISAMLESDRVTHARQSLQAMQAIQQQSQQNQQTQPQQAEQPASTQTQPPTPQTSPTDYAYPTGDGGYGYSYPDDYYSSYPYGYSYPYYYAGYYPWGGWNWGLNCGWGWGFPLGFSFAFCGNNHWNSWGHNNWSHNNWGHNTWANNGSHNNSWGSHNGSSWNGQSIHNGSGQWNHNGTTANGTFARNSSGAAIHDPSGTATRSANGTFRSGNQAGWMNHGGAVTQRGSASAWNTGHSVMGGNNHTSFGSGFSTMTRPSAGSSSGFRGFSGSPSSFSHGGSFGGSHMAFNSGSHFSGGGSSHGGFSGGHMGGGGGFGGAHMGGGGGGGHGGGHR